MSISSSDILTDFQLLTKAAKEKSVQSVSSSVRSVLLHFKRWLHHQKLSPKTLTNYVSDVKLFLSHLGHLPQSAEDFTGYTIILKSKSTPLSTINRKLASLRHLAKFLHETFSLSDFSAELDNIPQDPIDNLLKNFRYHLRRQGHKSKTIVNYISDVRRYLNWAIVQHGETQK